MLFKFKKCNGKLWNDLRLELSLLAITNHLNQSLPAPARQSILAIKYCFVASLLAMTEKNGHYELSGAIHCKEQIPLQRDFFEKRYHLWSRSPQTNMSLLP